MDRQVLLIGDTSRDEFGGVVSWLAVRSRLQCMPSLQGALAVAGSIRAPELIVLAQSWPGQISTVAVEEAHRVWPLARLVTLLGSWCEGETRSGRPCPGVWRIFWYDFVRRLEHWLQNVGPRGGVCWNLPRLSGESERLWCELNERPNPQRGRVAIVAHSIPAYEALSEACTAVGHTTCWRPVGDQRIVDRASAGIWDVCRGLELEWPQIEEFARLVAPATVVITVGFPRQHDVQRATRLGATVLAKPFQLPDLWRALGGTVSTGGIFSNGIPT